MITIYVPDLFYPSKKTYKCSLKELLDWLIREMH